MDNRERILLAAARVYAVHGFRGATTRLIANEAGVNEVTLFRTFGSKAALFEAMMHAHVAATPLPELPDAPADPQAELTSWCAVMMAHMREARSIIRTSIGEMGERPDAALSVCEGPSCAAVQLTAYVGRLRAAGLADETADVPTAVSMFMSSMFGDAVCRDIMPHAFPQPAEEAPARYVDTFLRAVGVSRAAVGHRIKASPQARRAAAK
ncbi:MAG TPA: helix-turn-helix domain-containing protein [Gemmatimonadaceae bacterium]|nr:helix-turn-helix domain-containing protein [Gemmatimonadaceae bacterium]